MTQAASKKLCARPIVLMQISGMLHQFFAVEHCHTDSTKILITGRIVYVSVSCHVYGLDIVLPMASFEVSDNGDSDVKLLALHCTISVSRISCLFCCHKCCSNLT